MRLFPATSWFTFGSAAVKMCGKFYHLLLPGNANVIPDGHRAKSPFDIVNQFMLAKLAPAISKHIGCHTARRQIEFKLVLAFFRGPCMCRKVGAGPRPQHSALGGWLWMQMKWGEWSGANCFHRAPTLKSMLSKRVHFSFFSFCEEAKLLKNFCARIQGTLFQEFPPHTDFFFLHLNWWREQIRRAHKNNNTFSFSLVCGKLQDKQLLKAPRAVNLWRGVWGSGSGGSGGYMELGGILDTSGMHIDSHIAFYSHFSYGD